MRYVEDARGFKRLGFALGGRAAGAAFAAGEVEDAGGPAEYMLDEEGASAGLLDVVPVRGDGKDVDGGLLCG